MTEITCEALNENAFQMIGKDWLLLTAKKDGKVNTMTASWGGVGVMWGKQVAFLFIRPQRYTKEFVDAAAEMSILSLIHISGGLPERVTLLWYGIRQRRG